MRRSAISRSCFLVAVLLLCHASSLMMSADFDLLIRGGHVIDPRNGIDGVLDVAIRGDRIAEVAAGLDPARARQAVDATGLLVTPGLLDLHVHAFHGTEDNADYSNGWRAVPPDGFTFRTGVTTVVDTGGAGWRNFHQFKHQTIDRSLTRVLALLNIVGAGMKGDPAEQDLNDMDARLTAQRARQFPGLIVGIKLAHYLGPEWDPVIRTVEAGRLADLPVMIDFGRHIPPLPIAELFLTHLRPGDIFTHVYAELLEREAVVAPDGKVRESAWEARRKGLIFDVGHGGGSFVFRQAVPAIRQGFLPDVISTDLHIGSMNGGMKDLLNVMSKFLNMGMTPAQVVDRATWQPARVIRREDLGHLSPGAEADLAVLRILDGRFGFVDVEGVRMDGSRKLECELTLRAGQVVWDLNGIAATATHPAP